MRRKRTKKFTQFGIIFIILIISLASISISYAAWYDTISIQGEINTGEWDASIKIQKTLDTLSPTNGYNEFLLSITVWNDGAIKLPAVNVTDTIGLDATPTPGTTSPSQGYVTWITTPTPTGELNNLTWYLGNLSAGQTALLTVELTITCTPATPLILYPLDTNGAISHPIIRSYYNGHSDETVYYRVETKAANITKFEDCSPQCLGEDGRVETDTFQFTVLGGGLTVTVGTKAGKPPEEWSTLTGIGDTITDSKGFIITFENIQNIGGGKKNYTITITSDDQTNTKALSHTTFKFNTGTCTSEINTGATVTTNAGALCGPLTATTESIAITIHPDGTITPPLPYSTPWAEAHCQYTYNCN